MEALATIGELENHLGRQFLTPDGQASAEQALLLASGAVRAYCGWDLSREPDAVMEVYADGTTLLSLPTLCLHTIARITIDGDDIAPLDRSVDLMWTRKGQIFRSEGWRKGAVVEVECDHGYDPVPDVLKLITLDLSSRQMSNPEGLEAARTGEVERRWSGTAAVPMSTLHQSLLDRHRLL